MRNRYTLLLFLLLTASPALLAQGWHSLYLNEVMASNDLTIADGNGENTDWIEVHNPGNTPYVLTGHYISDDPLLPTKHLFAGPDAALTIPANGFLILWASGEQAGGPAHLGFSLSASGEALYLTAPDGTTAIDSLLFGPQLTDVSYGRNTDGEEQWRFFEAPTPGATNNGSSGALGYLQPPVFSEPSGFYSGPFTVTITSPDPDVTIYYSRDGSDPGPERLSGESFTYKNSYPEAPGDPFGALLNDTMRSFVVGTSVFIAGTAALPNHLSAKSSTIDFAYPPPYMPTTLVRKARVIRARAYKAGYLPSPIVTHTYFITPGGANPYTLPIVCMATDEANLFGYAEGIHTAGMDFDAWRTNDPTSEAEGLIAGNWRRETEYPMSLELFNAQSTLRDHAVTAGFQMHGNYTLSYPRKSFKVNFRGNYGQSTLDHPIFPNQTDTAYKRLLIRNGGNDETITNLRDISMQKMVEHMRFATQDAQPSVLFINGELWGVNHVQERLDRHYVQRKYGIAEGELDLLEINASVVEGDATHYQAMMTLVSNSDMTQPAVYDQVRTLMDVDDYIDFQSACVFIGNTDWPHNNVKYFRKRTAAYEPNAPYGHDGRWRWMMYDTDFGFGYFMGRDASFDYLAWATSPTGNGFGSWSTRLFRRLLLNTTFKHAFINRHADMLNTAYRTERTSGIIDAYRNLMAPDMAEHFTRWVGRPGSYGVWDFNIDVMHTFAEERPAFARQELLTNFALPAMHDLVVDVSHTERGFVRVNTIDILETTPGVETAPYPWTGTYFQSVPITLTAHALPGYVFLHWTGAVDSTEPTISIDLTGTTSLVAVFGVAEPCPVELVHYWHFNDLASGVLQSIAPDQSLVPGAVITFPGTGAGYLDRTTVTEGTDLNAQGGTTAGRALRARNPSNTRELILRTPSKGFRDVTLTFATMRTTNGAEEQTVYFTTTADQSTWTILPPTYFTAETFGLKTFSLEGRPETYNNPHLAFRIVFSGANASGASGNNRFDNVTLAGIPIPTTEVVLCDADDSHTFFGTTYDTPGSYLHIGGNPALCSNVQALDLLAFAMDTTVVLSGATLTANAVSETYQWVNCNAGLEPIPGATEPVFEPEVNGTYAVTGVQDGCAWNSGCHTVLSTSVAAIGAGPVQVMPNPTLQDIALIAPVDLAGHTYRLVDQTGRLMATGTVAGPITHLAMGSYAPGIYLLELPGSGLPVLRVVKQ